MIREMRKSDIWRLAELQEDFIWDLSDGFIEGLVVADENDLPVMFAGAWMLAETHIAVDHKWSSPGARLYAVKQLHDAMQARLKARGIGQAVTWFDDTMNRFKQRLEKWGWVKSDKTSYHRSIT